MRHFSIQTRLLTLSGLIVLPIIIIGLGGQWRLNRTMTQEILTSVSNRISDNAARMDDKFFETNRLAASVLYSSRAKRVANPNDPMDNYDRSVNVNFLRGNLNSIRMSNPFVNNIRLYFPLMHVCYNADNAFDYGENRKLGSQSEMPESLFKELLTFQDMPGNLHIHNGNLVFIQYFSRSNPDIIIETIYASEELQAYLDDMLLYEDAFYYFITDYGSYTLTNSADISLNEKVKELEDDTPFCFKHNGKKYYAFSHDISNADSRYIQVIPYSQLLMNLSAATQYTAVFTVTVLFCIALVVIFSIRVLRKPIAELSQAFFQIENHEFDTRVGEPSVSDFIYLYNSFNSMAEKLDTLIQKELKHDLLLQKSQLKQLQAQINPHFLYNSFFMLNQMIARSMNDSARELTRELGTYFKYITRNYQDETPLEEEYQHAAVYASIQARRFEGRIVLKIDPLPEKYTKIKVPRLILQPILENAFQYGMAQKIRDGRIQMLFRTHPEHLEVIIEDNGDTLPDSVLDRLRDTLSSIQANSHEGETTGLINIAKRLQLYYNRKDMLTVCRSPLGGLQVTILLLSEVKSCID